jgi:hypothetical protein
MPQLRELTAAEVAGLEYGNAAVQAQIVAHYDTLLGSFKVGEYCMVQPTSEVTRQAVRACLVAAAERRGWQLLFVPTQGQALLFRVCKGVGS